MTLRDEIAKVMHDTWVEHMKQLLASGKQTVGGILMLEQNVKRLRQKMYADYDKLEDTQKAIFELSAIRVEEVINEYLA